MVDTVFRFSTLPGGKRTERERGSSDFDEGMRLYAEFDVYAEGTYGTDEEEQLGQGKWHGVSTEPRGTQGWWESMTIRFFDQGVIEGVDTGPPWEGAIIGGTGEFAGARGEYSGIEIGGHPFVSRITFTFENPPKPAD